MPIRVSFPDPTFHLDADSVRIRIRPQVLHLLHNQNFFIPINSSASLQKNNFAAVLRIRIRLLLGLPDPDLYYEVRIRILI
jgi:hypothetical protein